MKTYFYFFKCAKTGIFAVEKQFNNDADAFQHQFTDECRDDHENDVVYIGFNDKPILPETNISLLDAEKAIRAYNFSFTNQGVFNVFQLVDYFETEGDDTETKTFLAAVYAIDCCEQAGTFDEENAEAHLEFLNGYGVNDFDFYTALKICATAFQLIESNIIEIE